MEQFSSVELKVIADALEENWRRTYPAAKLREDWQAENEAAAKVVMGIIREQGVVDVSDEQQRLLAGRQIHDAWLERNQWARGGDLDKPFEELSPEEQAKDIDQLVVAQKLLIK